MSKDMSILKEEIRDLVHTCMIMKDQMVKMVPVSNNLDTSNLSDLVNQIASSKKFDTFCSFEKIQSHGGDHELEEVVPEEDKKEKSSQKGYQLVKHNRKVKIFLPIAEEESDYQPDKEVYKMVFKKCHSDI